MKMDKEERYWEQRDRVNWLKMGDKNTSFFHKFAIQRRCTNRIRGLQRSDGSMASDYVEIETMIRNYFADLFKSRGTIDLGHVLLGVQRCITDSMNQRLLAPYTEEEIVDALKGMGPIKASGPDGLPTIFY
ncbi:hypothetical protein J1N35_046062 [Gossypium stocksii]|uniref:Reverse transcriptase domain-containing protein n=1 Tax=Gossypium stocksii TaxID=47602 RepID=A0A9D3ZDS5_9ROSI|nr:hypothetical protein J1N35_046062 [Gossypium stocksii]